jgi:UPF0042 nucleotide-binding protein
MNREIMRIVIITGLSGSGKSTAIRALEDIGFFCIDNLPVTLLPKFIELCIQSSREITRIAIVMDVRGRDFLNESPLIFSDLKIKGYRIEVLFLEASDEVLIRRFKETRRRHPLADSGSPLKGISLEREILASLRESADKVIDTTNMNVHELKDTINQYFSKPEKKMTVILESFGYRYGIPYEADIVMDIRFLPNPYFVDSLKDLSGMDKEVSDYMLRYEDTENFLRRFSELINYLLPLYEKEGKLYLTIAIGCTGGKHRSVAIVNELYELIDSKGYNLNIKHRDLNKI